MPRRPRSVFPDYAFFHVTTRGVDRMPIVYDDADRSGWVFRLDRTIDRFGWTWHAFCLMTNHFHLVIEAERERLSRGMHSLNGAYAQRFNQRHRRTGHLFEQRFVLRLIESDEYLAEACEYVRANPVRAGLCSSPRDWPWSG